MYRKRHKRGKRLASVFLTVALITATVPVQAAEFGTPDSFEEIFSSGEEDSCITDTENTLPAHRLFALMKKAEDRPHG